MSKLFDLGFRRTESEIVLESVPVRGKLPAWLWGTLLRNGPGTFEVGEQSYRHWFDGLAMLHKFSIANGRVAYANKFLDCDAYRQARDTGKIAYSEFATDPCRSMFGRISSVFSPKVTDSAKVSIGRLAGHFLALAETPIQVEFDPETLATVGVFNFEDRLSGQMTTVHPQFDQEQGSVYNVVTRYHQTSHYNIYCMEKELKPRRVASLPVKQPAYMHSFGMTEHYIILAEFPLVVNPLNLLLWLRPYIENFRWKPARGTPFWVIERKTGRLVGRYDSPPFFAFHHVNAFEQGDDIILDIVAYPDAQVLSSYYLNRLKDANQRIPAGNLRRYRIPLRGKTATYETLSSECMELSHFDAGRFNMKPDYRYVYAMSVQSQEPYGFYNQLVKFDIATQATCFWFEQDCYPGEPVFVGKPGRVLEDDGVILSVVLDAANATSFLLVLDAQSFSEIARAVLPQPVLIGYHGAFYEDV